MIVGILKILKKRSRIVAFFSRKCPYRTHVLDAIATPEAGCSAPGFTQRKRSTIFMFWSYLICALASGAALRFYLHAGVSATTFWAHARWLSFCRKLLFFACWLHLTAKQRSKQLICPLMTYRDITSSRWSEQGP